MEEVKVEGMVGTERAEDECEMRGGRQYGVRGMQGERDRRSKES